MMSPSATPPETTRNGIHLVELIDGAGPGDEERMRDRSDRHSDWAVNEAEVAGGQGEDSAHYAARAAQPVLRATGPPRSQVLSVLSTTR